MNRLIVNADDFGLSRSVNEAVIRAHREGILTTASLMVGEAGFVEQIEERARLGHARSDGSVKRARAALFGGDDGEADEIAPDCAVAKFGDDVQLHQHGARLDAERMVNDRCDEADDHLLPLPVRRRGQTVAVARSQEAERRTTR